MADDWHRKTATALGAAIGAGEIDPVALTEHFLDRIAAEDPDHRIYLRLTRGRARAEAQAARQRARNGARAGPLDGVPISWKDIFDTAGVATEMGSPLFAGRVPKQDAEALKRASRAGLVCLGKTNTVQFALGGIGHNTHTGTPPTPAMTDCPRAPGGSSSGAATATARNLAAAGIGSDTGGSVRIPAAWNGLVGLKTSFGAIPNTGVMPLAPTLDTVGPLTRSVADAAALFSILADLPPVDLAGGSVAGMRFLVADSVVWDGAEPAVAKAVRAAIDRLDKAGADIVTAAVPAFAEIEAVLNRHGGIVTAEGYVTWKETIDRHGDRIDRFVLDRFHQGRDMSAPDIEILRKTARAQTKALYRQMTGFDGILAPTVPILPPPIAEMDDTDAYAKANGLALHNTRIGNVLPCCALTLPCGAPEAPAGLMVMAPAGQDRALLRTGAIVERTLKNTS